MRDDVASAAGFNGRSAYRAGVAELAYAPGLGPGGLRPVGVQVPPPASRIAASTANDRLAVATASIALLGAVAQLAKAPVSKTGDSRFESWLPRLILGADHARTMLLAPGRGLSTIATMVPAHRSHRRRSRKTGQGPSRGSRECGTASPNASPLSGWSSHPRGNRLCPVKAAGIRAGKPASSLPIEDQAKRSALP